MENTELYHYGIKGMKWGVRRARKTMSTLKTRRNAMKGYAQDAYNSNKTGIGKAYDKLTGAHKIQAEMKYASASKKERAARAEQYVKDQLAAKAAKNERISTIKQMQKEINKGESFVGKAYNKLTGADRIQAEIMYDSRKRK